MLKLSHIYNFCFFVDGVADVAVLQAAADKAAVWLARRTAESYMQHGSLDASVEPID